MTSRNSALNQNGVRQQKSRDMYHDKFFGNDKDSLRGSILVMIQLYGIKIRRLVNKQLDNFVKNRGNCPCFTEDDSFWPLVKFDPLCTV